MTELVQPYFGRRAEWADMFADCFGIAIEASGRILSVWQQRVAVVQIISIGPG